MLSNMIDVRDNVGGLVARKVEAAVGEMLDGGISQQYIKNKARMQA